MEKETLLLFLTVGGAIFGYHKYLMSWINKKLDKELYDRDTKNFREWSDARDKEIDKKVEKLESTIEKNMGDIKKDIQLIREHILGCKKG